MDGVAAHVEEIPVEPGFRYLQDVAPNIRNSPLQGRAFGARGGGRCRRPGGRGQRLDVQLAVDGEREPLHKRERGGHHVFRQPAAQRLPERPKIQVSARALHDVGGQFLLSGRGFADHDHALADSRVPIDLRGNLAELDAKAPDLHLLVDTAEIFQVSIRQMPAEIARSVQALARHRRKGILDESLRREFRSIQITASKSFTTHVISPGCPAGTGRCSASSRCTCKSGIGTPMTLPAARSDRPGGRSRGPSFPPARARGPHGHRLAAIPGRLPGAVPAGETRRQGPPGPVGVRHWRRPDAARGGFILDRAGEFRAVGGGDEPAGAQQNRGALRDTGIRGRALRTGRAVHVGRACVLV